MGQLAAAWLASNKMKPRGKNNEGGPTNPR